MKKIFFLIAAIIGFMFSSTFAQSQHLFSVSYNGLSSENVVQISTQLADAEVSSLSLIKNNEKTEVYSVGFSSVEHTKIVILNAENGMHVVITPVETLRATSLPAEFQITSFFIEELKQSTLGTANTYLIIETDLDFSVKNIASIAATRGEVFIPQYFYGKKEDVKEALPQDRRIIDIYKQSPRIISDLPDTPENQRYIAQLEEEMSHYVYIYEFPDGTLCTYAEHSNPKNGVESSTVGSNLKFNLTGLLTPGQRLSTEYGLELWSEQLAGTVPISINVDFYPMGEGVIGACYWAECFFSTADNTWYPSSLWNQKVGYNANPSRIDIDIVMNSEFAFYFGLDAQGNNIDYPTIVIHEVTHGLGFGSRCLINGNYAYGTHPVIYDRQLCQGLDGPYMTELTQSQRAALIVSENLYAGRPGSNLLEANGGVRVKMYAPTTYRGGSTAHHWASNVSFPTFMKYAYMYPLHTFNTRKIGMLLDLGWTKPEIAPNAVWVTYDGNGGEGNMNPQPFTPGVSQNLKIAAFERRGYTFIGWNTSPDGTGTSYLSREAVTISGDLLLYAQWEAQVYTLSFHAYAGAVQPASKRVTYDSPLGELPIPVRPGYRFDEWRLSLVTLTEETLWNHLEDRTTTARWTLITGIDEMVNDSRLQIFPNPAKHTIELQITNYELRVDKVDFFNIFGQLVKSVPFAGQTTEVGVSQHINISDLSAGTYMVRVGNEVVKLVVN